MNNIKKLAPGVVLHHLTEKFLSAEYVSRWFLDQLHPNGPKCPKCGVIIDDRRRLGHWYNLERMGCRGCGKFISSTEGTVLHGIRFDHRSIFLIAALTDLGISPKIIGKIIKTTPYIVQDWQKKLGVLPG